MQPKKIIQVAKLPSAPKTQKGWRTLLAKLCYFYPQYTLAQARRLPYKDVLLLLREADRQEAARYHNFTQIATAPHSKKGEAVKQLTDHFRSAMKQ